MTRLSGSRTIIASCARLSNSACFLTTSCRFTFRDVVDFNDRTDRYAVAKDRIGRIPHREKGAVFAHEKVLASHGFPHPYRLAQRAFARRVAPPIWISMVDLV